MNKINSINYSKSTTLEKKKNDKIYFDGNTGLGKIICDNLKNKYPTKSFKIAGNYLNPGAECKSLSLVIYLFLNDEMYVINYLYCNEDFLYEKLEITPKNDKLEFIDASFIKKYVIGKVTNGDILRSLFSQLFNKTGHADRINIKLSDTLCFKKTISGYKFNYNNFISKICYRQKKSIQLVFTMETTEDFEPVKFVDFVGASGKYKPNRISLVLFDNISFFDPGFGKIDGNFLFGLIKKELVQHINTINNQSQSN